MLSTRKNRGCPKCRRVKNPLEDHGFHARAALVVYVLCSKDSYERHLQDFTGVKSSVDELDTLVSMDTGATAATQRTVSPEESSVSPFHHPFPNVPGRSLMVVLDIHS